MPKITLKRPDVEFYRGWTFVLVVGLALAVIALISRGGIETTPTSQADGSTGCQVEVTAETLNVRAGPAQAAELLETLPQGEVVDATRVVTDGFRELEDGRWVADQFVTPLPSTNCA